MNLGTSRPPGVVLPGEGPRRNRTTVVVMVLVALCLVAGAVVVVNLTRDTGGGSRTGVGGEPAASTAPAAPTTTPDPETTTKAAILDAYRQSFDAYVAVASDPNGSPDDPRLSQHKIGNALLASQISIKRLRNEGQVLVGHAELHPTVVELASDSAVVTDCSLDQFATVEVATGRVVEPAGPPTPGAATATYRLLDGVWMQNGFKDEKRSCVPPAS